MKHLTPLRPVPLKDEKSLFTLVENRSAYTMEHCELNVFETHRQAHHVHLEFNDLVFTAMLRGKKVMHLFDKPGFEYLPGESVIVPANEMMRIDFPEACSENPTQCLALAISSDQIRKTLQLLNEQFPKSSQKESWQLHDAYYHLANSESLNEILNRLIHISIKEENRSKDVLVDLNLQELLVRLMQTQARSLLEENCKELSNAHPFAAILSYVKENLHQDIRMDQLSKKACMSRTSFFRNFKNELGITPYEFIQKERIEAAKRILREESASVSATGYRVGYNDPTSFIKAFKKAEGLTPKAYQDHFYSFR